MTERIRLGVIFGGRSGEHEVSLMSARSVISALDPQRYEIVEIGISKEGRWFGGHDVLAAFEGGRIESLSPVFLLAEPENPGLLQRVSDGGIELLSSLDVVFPVLHGTFGEDGTLQGLLELADIAYVGAGVLASAVAMDKSLFKQLMRAHDIPVVDWITLNAAELETRLEFCLEQAELLGDYPFFTKPANLGSSVGVSKCNNRSDLVEGLRDAAQYDRRLIVELGLDAREIEVSVLGNEEPHASIAGEIVPGDAFYSYKAKYLDDSSELIIPAPIGDDLMEEARSLAVQAFKAIDGAGMARVDFLLDRHSDRLYMNEINTIPGFTRISMYPKLWAASGVVYSKLLDRLVELARERYQQKQALVRSFGGAA
ncbi:MAG: D-alanine--D-alanine ligase family protein [Anaerolineales bacterium]